MRNSYAPFPIALSLCFVVSMAAQDSAQDKKNDDSMQYCPIHQQHAKAESHDGIVEKHGDQAMGFPHGRTTHHFLLTADGGTIAVAANDANDKLNIEAVRTHLSHITAMFTNGDFSTPTFVHNEIPPGATSMQLLKAAIHYRYEEVPSGGRVHIESNDPVAIAAIHDFLRFQIGDHQTGDNLVLEEVH